MNSFEKYRQPQREERAEKPKKQAENTVKAEKNSGDEEHLTYEQLFTALTAGKDSEVLKDVLSHCAVCDMCRENFELLQKASEAFLKLRHADDAILSACLFGKDIPKELESDILLWKKSGFKRYHPVKIKSADVIEVKKSAVRGKAFETEKEGYVTSVSDGDMTAEGGDTLKITCGGGLAFVFRLPFDGKDALKAVKLGRGEKIFELGRDFFEKDRYYTVIIQKL